MTQGHCNPHGLDIDPRDGPICNTGHGRHGGDEFNLVLPAHNYGLNHDRIPIAGETHEERKEQPVK